MQREHKWKEHGVLSILSQVQKKQTNNKVNVGKSKVIIFWGN